MTKKFIDAIKNANPFSGTELFKFTPETYEATRQLLLDWNIHNIRNYPQKKFYHYLGFGNYGSMVSAHQKSIDDCGKYISVFNQCKPNRFVKKEHAILFI